MPKRKTDAEFKAEVKAKYGNEYQVKGNYKNMNTKIKVEHMSCGHVWLVNPNNFLRGHRCPRCQKENRIRKITDTTFNFIQKLEKVSPTLHCISQYKNSHTKVKVICEICQNIFGAFPYNLLGNESKCPYCRSSRGEQMVKEYLQTHELIFKRQARFIDCKDKIPLPFDFMVLNSDKSIKCLIEYQGAQHFYSKHDGGNHGFFNLDSIHKHDTIKNNWCNKHHIQLIHINHPQDTAISNTYSFIRNLVKATLDRELK